MHCKCCDVSMSTIGYSASNVGCSVIAEQHSRSAVVSAVWIISMNAVMSAKKYFVIGVRCSVSTVHANQDNIAKEMDATDNNQILHQR